MADQLAGLASILQNMKIPDGVKPLSVSLPKPPALEGPLLPNDWLTRAQPFAQNAISGPESMVVVDGYIYTGLDDGWVVEVRPNGSVRRILRMSYDVCGRAGAPEGSCGRPMGVRADRNGYLVVADAYHGIFRINPQTGRFLQLVDARNTVVNGKKLGFINDLAVASDGTIFFTSASDKWPPSKSLNIIFEAETSGRVLVYNPRERAPERRVQELVTKLNYPDGVQLSEDESYLLIAEGGRSKIYRAWIGPSSPKFGQIETFAQNLPGFIANIRRSPRNTYWVGMSRARHAKLPSILDIYGDQPGVRGSLIALAEKQVMFDDPKYGLVLEMDTKGNIIRTLQDPDGTKYSSVSEVAEEKGILYIASPQKKFVGILNLHTLPSVGTGVDKPAPADPSSKPPPAGNGTGVINITPGSIDDTAMRQILENVRNNLRKMTISQVEQVVLVLVRKLIELQVEARRAMERANKLESDLQRLQELIGQSGGPSGSSTPAPTTARSLTPAATPGPTTGTPAPTTTMRPPTPVPTPPGGAIGPDSGGAAIQPPGSLGSPTSTFSPSGGSAGTTPGGVMTTASITTAAAATTEAVTPPPTGPPGPP